MTEPLAALLATFGSSAPVVTMMEIARDVELAGIPVEGVPALLVLSGTLALDIEGDERRTVRAGRLALVQPGRALRLSSARGAPSVVLDGRRQLVRRDGWLVVDAARGGDPALVVAAGRIAGSAAHALPRTILSAVSRCRVGRPLLTMLRDEYGRGAAGQPALASALMNACVVQGLRRAIERGPAVPDEREHAGGLAARAVSAIRSRPADSHSVETLADIAGLSRSTFLRHFKRLTRMAPGEYVQHVRLDEARTLLETTDLPVKTIAGLAGFASRSHFSRAFSARFGRDPTGFRGDRGIVDTGDGA